MADTNVILTMDMGTAHLLEQVLVGYEKLMWPFLGMPGVKDLMDQVHTLKNDVEYAISVAEEATNFPEAASPCQEVCYPVDSDIVAVGDTVVYPSHMAGRDYSPKR